MTGMSRHAPPMPPGMQAIRKLGEGGMGAVWLVQTRGGRRALKRLSLESDPESLERFRREAEALARASRHPGVVKVHATHTEPSPALELEFIDGPDLESRLASGPFAIDAAVELGMAVAEALAHLHDQGIVHRDLKPANILLAPRGPVLTDFGVSRIESLETLTKTGAVIGTPSIMSPEQVEGRGVDARSDVWAFGVLLHRLVTGRLPFPADSAVAIMRKILIAEPAAPSRVCSEIPAWLEDLILDCLEKDPERRPRDGQELVERLATRPASRSSGLGRGLKFIAALGLTLLLGLGAVLVVQRRHEREQRRGLRDRLIGTVRDRLRSLDGKTGPLARELLVEPLRAPGRPRDAGPLDTDRTVARSRLVFESLVRDLNALESMLKADTESLERLEARVGRQTVSLALLLHESPDRDRLLADSGPLSLQRVRALARVMRDGGALSVEGGDSELAEILRPVLAFSEAWKKSAPADRLLALAELGPVAVKREMRSLALCRALFLELLRDPASTGARELVVRLTETAQHGPHTIEWQAVLVKETSPDLSPVAWLGAVLKARELGSGPAHLVADVSFLLRRRPDLEPLIGAAVADLCQPDPGLSLEPYPRMEALTELALALRSCDMAVPVLPEMSDEVFMALVQSLARLGSETPDRLARKVRLFDRLGRLDRLPRFDKMQFHDVARRWLAFGAGSLCERAGLEPDSVLNAVLLCVGKRVSETDPGDTLAFLGRAIRARRGSPSMLAFGIRHFLHAVHDETDGTLRRKPYEPESWLPLARVVARSGDPERDVALAAMALREQRLKAPPEVRLELAALLESDLERLGAANPAMLGKRRWAMTSVRASALVELGRRDEALGELRELDPREMRGGYVRALAETLAELGRPDVAKTVLEERLDVVTDIGETTKLVMLLAELGFRAEARRRTALLAAQPLETVQDRIRIIGLLIELGDQEAARRRARSLARDDSLLPPDRIDLAEQLIRLSDDATAESLLERAIRGGEGGERLRFRRLRLLKGIDLRRERVEADAREGGS